MKPSVKCKNYKKFDKNGCCFQDQRLPLSDVLRQILKPNYKLNKEGLNLYGIFCGAIKQFYNFLNQQLSSV